MKQVKGKSVKNMYLYKSWCDSPTVVHRLTAERFSKKCKEGDEVWIFPVYNGKEQISYEDRMEMARIAMKGIPKVSVTSIDRTLLLDLLAAEKRKPGNKNRKKNRSRRRSKQEL